MTSCLIFAFFFFESVLLAQYIFVYLLCDLIAVCAFRGYPRKESTIQLKLPLHLFINHLVIELIQTYCMDSKPGDVLELDDTYSIHMYSIHTPYSIHLPPITEIRSDPVRYLCRLFQAPTIIRTGKTRLYHV